MLITRADVAPAESEQAVRSVASRLSCVECQGLSVWESNSENSLRMRDEIRGMLRQGMSQREILQHYMDVYGDWILLSPPWRGLGITAYVAPLLILLLGGWLLNAWLRQRPPVPPHPQQSTHTGTTDEDMIEAALRIYRGQDQS